MSMIDYNTCLTHGAYDGRAHEMCPKCQSPLDMTDEQFNALEERREDKADASRYRWLCNFGNFSVVDEALNSVEFNTVTCAVDHFMANIEHTGKPAQSGDAAC